MNFKIQKRMFNNVLAVVAKAISNSAPIPSLSGVKITVSEENVTFIGSDSNISIKTVKLPSDELVIVEEGEAVIDIRYISEIVRKIDSDMVNVEIIDGTLCKISGNKSEFKINGMRPSDYPNINFDHSSDFFELDVKKFSDLVHRTVFACSDQQIRQALTGLNLKTEGDKLVASATDSYRLSSMKIDFVKNGDFNITIPSKIISETCNIMADEKKIRVYIDKNKAFFNSDETTVLTRLIEDAFPNTSHLLNIASTQVLQIDARSLQDAVDRASFIKSDGKSVVKLKINTDSLEVSSSSQEIGSSHEVLSIASYSGEPLVISCSGKYLSDAIKALRSDVMTMSFKGESKPIIILSPEDPDIIEYISPVRTYN